MRKLIIVALVLLPSLALTAESPFTGTWKANLGSAKMVQKPDTWVLQNGRYQCQTCTPAIDVQADGSDQATPGNPSADTLAVKTVSPTTIEITAKKSGKLAGVEKRILSADGKTLTVEFTAYPEASKEPVTGKVVLARLAPGPTGSHAVSGSWRLEKFDTMSDNALTITFKETPDGMSMSSPTGAGYDAKFDGKEYPMTGDPTIETVSLKKVSDREIIETDKRGGKIVFVTTFTVSADGKTLSAKGEDKERGAVTTFTAAKQ